MKANRFFWAALIAAGLVGCSQEDSLEFANDMPVVYTGSMEKTASRVLLEQDYSKSWEMGDELTIFPKFDINNQYKVSAINGGSATFELVDFIDKSDYQALDNTYAVYPYYDENQIEGEVITTSVPAEISYSGMANSIKYALMSAKSATEKLTFTNAQGILRLRLNAVTPFQYGAIQSIKLESASNKLSGTATIDYSEGETPEAKIVTGENYLVINLAEELQNDLPTSKSGEWAEFFVPVVPTLFKANDLTVTITWKNGSTHAKAAGIDISIERKKVYTLNYTVGDTPIYEGELEGAEEDKQVWDGETATIPEPVVDEATGKEYYPVTQASDLAGLAALVNGTASRAAASNAIDIKLTGDIDLAGNEWTPIGTSSQPYKGTFDGCGYAIKNLVVTGNNSYVGLFGNTNNGEIKNLTIENAMVSGRLNVGVVSGQPYTSKYTNITVKGHVEVNGMAYVGGVGGKNAYANWENITVDVDADSYVNANSVENGTAYRSYVGGVVGFNGEGGHSFKNITSNIDVKGSTCDVGGLFGIAHYGNQFENCSSSGDVEIYAASEAAEAEEIGGIAGVWNNGGADVKFTGCAFTGTLKTNIEEGVDLKDNTIVGNAYAEKGKGKLFIDGKCYVASADALVAALEENLDVTLAGNVKIDPANMSNAYGTTGINVKNGQAIDGGGYTLDIKGAGGTWDSGINTTGGLIKNITVTGSFRGIFVNHNSDYSEKVVLENVTTTGTTYTISCDQGTSQGLEATGCTFNGWTSYAATIGNVKFTNCNFNEGNGYAYCRPYAPTEFVGCNFEEGFQLDARAAVTFENCKLNGVEITAENLAQLVTSNIANATVK